MPKTLPDYVRNPNAVLGDDARWRFSKVPNYEKTRAYAEKTKTMNHKAGSLEEIVENLVKNWEIEASYKTVLTDWRTVDHRYYTSATNGGAPQPGSHMLAVGTYNAMVPPNEFYSPEHSDFAASHVTFKRMIPTFAWEVLEVYSGPPVVAFRWRHWGQMKSDYYAYNNKGEEVTAKAHGGELEIQGVTVAKVNDQLQIEKLETWFDPVELFRQLGPIGKVGGESAEPGVGEDTSDAKDYLNSKGHHGTSGASAFAGGCPMKGKL